MFEEFYNSNKRSSLLHCCLKCKTHLKGLFAFA
jgi:hypothetical protein